MLRFYKVLKRPSKVSVQQCIDLVKAPDFKTFSIDIEDVPQNTHTLNAAIVWCRGAHKLFDMEPTKLEVIHTIQRHLESFAAQGLQKDPVKVLETIKKLQSLGFSNVEASGAGNREEAYEDLLDHVNDHKYQLRRSLRLAYEARIMNA